MAPTDLLILIKLLKAEGVQEYEADGCRLVFSNQSATGGEGSGRHHQAVPPAQEAQEAADPEAPEVVLPAALRKLNPNYLKLTGLVKR